VLTCEFGPGQLLQSVAIVSRSWRAALYLSQNLDTIQTFSSLTGATVVHKDVKRFFVHGLFLALPLAVLLGYVEYRLRAIPNSYNTKRAYLERQLDSIEVLVLGSSQAYDGINPSLFNQRGFNLGDIGQSLFFDMSLTQKYIDRMPRLRCVVLALSYFSFGFELEDTGESWRDYYYYHFWDIKSNGIRWYDPRTLSYIALYTPKVVLRFAAHGFEVNEAQTMQPNGWNRSEGTVYEAISDSLGHARVKLHNILMNHSRVNENFRNLSALFADLKRRGVKIVIVTPPTYSTYVKFADANTLELNRRLIDSLCVAHGCEYADFFADPRFVITDFNDNDHLNMTGAEKFTRIVNDEVLSRVFASD
jgi:hypothetical protein